MVKDAQNRGKLLEGDRYLLCLGRLQVIHFGPDWGSSWAIRFGLHDVWLEIALGYLNITIYKKGWG